MRLTLLVALAAFVLAACGQSQPPAKGEQGEAGPVGLAGPAGPPGPPGASGPPIRIASVPCDQTACGVNCNANERILNAYALNPGGTISFEDESHLIFRPRRRPAVVVLACVGQ
jgi:hypothetical protein